MMSQPSPWQTSKDAARIAATADAEMKDATRPIAEIIDEKVEAAVAERLQKMEETEEKNTKKKPTTVMDPSNTKPKAVAADAGASTKSKPVPSKVANAAKKSKIHTKDDLVNDGRDGNQAKGKNKENEREKQKLKKRKQKESNDPTVLGAQYKH